MRSLILLSFSVNLSLQVSLSILRFSFSNSCGSVARVGFVFVDFDVLFAGVTLTDVTGGMRDDKAGALTAEEVEHKDETEEALVLVNVTAVEVTTDKGAGTGR